MVVRGARSHSAAREDDGERRSRNIESRAERLKAQGINRQVRQGRRESLGLLGDLGDLGALADSKIRPFLMDLTRSAL